MNDVSATMFRINTDKVLSSRPINPLIYGNFLELGLAHQADGMWSQMLYNRSFESIAPPTTMARDGMGPVADRTAAWWHSGYEEQSWYTYDESGKHAISTDRASDYAGFFHGRIAAEALHEGPGAWGIGQDGLWLRPGVSYRFRGFLMGGGSLTALTGCEGSAGSDDDNRLITVQLIAQDQPTHVIASGQCAIGRSFTECILTLENPDYTGRASFRILATWPGKLRADGFELYPSDAVKGWRRDIVDSLKRVRPTIVRFPGGCFASFYNWRDGIGSRDERMPMRSEFWGGIEYNDIGTDEFLDLCGEIGCEPFLVVNLLTGTPELAADWVEYCNGPTQSAQGKRRAANGHVEPRRVTYWELDNEPVRKFNAEQYAHRVVAYARAMKAADPTVKLAIEGYDYPRRLSRVLDICGPYIDFVSDRYYSEADIERDIACLRDYHAKTGRRIGLCNTEWIAPTAPPAGEAHRAWAHDRSCLQRWFYALNAAIVVQRFQRYAEWFDFANFNNLVNTWGQNVIESSKSAAWLSCAGKFFEFAVDTGAKWPVEIQPCQEGSIYAAAALSDSRRQLIVSLVNTGEATELYLETPGEGWKLASSRGIAAPELQSRNTEDQQDTVQAMAPPAWHTGSNIGIAMPAYSICEIVLDS